MDVRSNALRSDREIILEIEVIMVCIVDAADSCCMGHDDVLLCWRVSLRVEASDD